MSIYDFLKAERLKRNISIRKFAKLCNISNSTMADYENKRLTPSIKSLLKISEALNIDIFNILKNTTYLEEINEGQYVWYKNKRHET